MTHVSMTKKLFALVAVIVLVGAAGLMRAGADRLPSVDVAQAQAPTPTVSVTTLPAMPGKPTPGPAAPSPSPEMPLVTPEPTSAPMAGGAPTQPPVGTAFIQVEGQVANPLSLSLNQLQHMKSLSLTLHFHTYTGVPLQEILAQAQPTFSSDPETLMRKYVYFEGFDGKNAILSFPEFSKAFNGQLVLLAYVVDLHDVKPPGFVQLVVQGDKSNARFIKIARVIVGEPPTPH
ncbi:MAG: hypothetical protein JO009_09285 [Candidatus Eremiobacteraeota bacterium]|nr:hypothetical protein [Candidatus Eremiobacteraeota bacterium]